MLNIQPLFCPDYIFPTISTDPFFDLTFLRNEQSAAQPNIPDEYDDILSDADLEKEKQEAKVTDGSPDNVYNMGDLLYK